MVRTRHFHCQGLGSIPGQGTKIPQATQLSQKKLKIKKKILNLKRTFEKKRKDTWVASTFWLL